MLYPIAIKHGDDTTAHSIIFPDVPNLASACDELDDVLAVATECIDLHFNGLVEDGDDIPLPSKFSTHQANSEYHGFMWAWIDVDLSKYDTKSHKINITLPQFLINKIDEKVSAHKLLYKNRSNYLAQLASRDLAQ
ncbi:MAG: type II toxin-antitoxin system HicB family antitoxin [Moraxella sp.]|nr:type II toxin-antitoxin system HicB family antitoxin [Moraxella sp.]